jgi:hypothetical protein
VAYSPPPGQQYYLPYQPYQAYPPYPPARPTNGVAIAALVCGIAAFVVGITCIPAIICGHIARRQIRRTGEQGDGMALAGLILGYVGVVIFIVLVLVMGLLLTKAASSVSVAHGAPVAPGAPAVQVPTVIPMPAIPGPGN